MGTAFGHVHACSCGDLGPSCAGQMPFPPEYLAPPAERMKKERKTKTPKNKKETTGKVRGRAENKIFKYERKSNIKYYTFSKGLKDTFR